MWWTNKLRRISFFELSYWLSTVAVVVLYFSRAANHIYLDDSFITLRYVRNVITGNGFIFNPGEKVMGYSNPGYAVFLILLALSRLPLVHLVNWSFLVAGVLLVLALGAFFRKVRAPQLGPLVCLFFITDPLWTSLKGMETSLFVLLATVTLVLLLHRRFVLGSATAAWATLCRPDAVVVAA
jgi:hypothetical protein